MIKFSVLQNLKLWNIVSSEKCEKNSEVFMLRNENLAASSQDLSRRSSNDSKEKQKSYQMNMSYQDH